MGRRSRSWSSARPRCCPSTESGADEARRAGDGRPRAARGALGGPRRRGGDGNGCGSVYVEREGRIEPTPVEFSSDDEVREAIERILAPTGRRVDELSPMADARLSDGSRVNVVVPPLAVDGPAISIRRFGVNRPGPEELVESGSLSPEAAELLAAAVVAGAPSWSPAARDRARRLSSTPSRRGSAPASG